MAEVTVQARIPAPAAEALRARLTDFTSYDAWNVTHTGFPDGGPSPLVTGAVYQENLRMMGFPAEVEWTVVAHEPEREPATEGMGPMGVGLANRYTLATGPDGGTDLRIDSSFTGAAVSLMAGRIKDSAAAAPNESLRKPARLVEQA